MTGQWFSPGTPVSSTNKTDCYDSTELLNKPNPHTIVRETTHFIGITDIYKQNNSNSTIGFRNKQMLFLNLFPMKNSQISQKIYMHADLNFKLVRIIYTMRGRKKCM